MSLPDFNSDEKVWNAETLAHHPGSNPPLREETCLLPPTMNKRVGENIWQNIGQGA
jgi:hypothetical protein